MNLVGVYRTEIIGEVMNKINQAREFAKERHKGQWYGDKDYFDWHIEGVVELIKNNIPNSLFEVYPYYDNLIVTTLLHDILEDTNTTEDEITELFGVDISSSVKILTRKESETYFEYIDRVSESKLCALIKYYDVFYNLNQTVSDSIVGKLNIDKYSRYMKALERLGRNLYKGV